MIAEYKVHQLMYARLIKEHSDNMDSSNEYGDPSRFDIPTIFQQALLYASNKLGSENLPLKPYIVRAVYARLLLSISNDVNINDILKLEDLVPVKVDVENLDKINEVTKEVIRVYNEIFGDDWYRNDDLKDGWLAYTKHYFYLEMTKEGSEYINTIYKYMSSGDNLDNRTQEDIDRELSYLTNPEVNIYTHAMWVNDVLKNKSSEDNHPTVDYKAMNELKDYGNVIFGVVTSLESVFEDNRLPLVDNFSSLDVTQYSFYKESEYTYLFKLPLIEDSLHTSLERFVDFIINALDDTTIILSLDAFLTYTKDDKVGIKEAYINSIIPNNRSFSNINVTSGDDYLITKGIIMQVRHDV